MLEAGDHSHGGGHLRIAGARPHPSTQAGGDEVVGNSNGGERGGVRSTAMRGRGLRLASKLAERMGGLLELR